MPRPNALDDDKRSTICSLVASGVSLRQAAHHIGCDPKSIRREANRNDDFGRQLAKAKSEAKIHPLQTLHQAAQTNWRAALKLMELTAPRSTRRIAPVATKRDVNFFISTLVEAIERVVKNAWEREHLFEIVSAAMPPTIRHCWEGLGPRRDLKQLISDFENSTNSAANQRRRRRLELAREMLKYLPDHLGTKLFNNRDLIQLPEPTVDESSDSPRQKMLATARRHNSPPTDSSPAEQFASPEQDFASPDENNVRCARPNSGDTASPAQDNQRSPNDLRMQAEAKVPE
jgi:hypothetical protein